MHLKTAFLTVLLSFFMVAGCSGQRTTEIKAKGKGDRPDPNPPTKPEKAMHDSLGQLAMAASDFVELELIIDSLLRSDLTAVDSAQKCPRRLSDYNSGNSYYYSLDWESCGNHFERIGVDCVEIKYNNPDDQSLENINEIVLNSSNNSTPESGCSIDNSKYQSESVSVSIAPKLTITQFEPTDNDLQFSFRRDQNFYYQRTKSKLNLKYESRIRGNFSIPKVSSYSGEVSYFIDSLRTTLTEYQEKSKLRNFVTLQTSNVPLKTHPDCGFLQGELLIDIESDHADKEIKNQLISLTETSASSPMTNRKINWPECKKTTRLANIRVITDYFRLFKANK